MQFYGSARGSGYLVSESAGVRDWLFVGGDFFWCVWGAGVDAPVRAHRLFHGHPGRRGHWADDLFRRVYFAAWRDGNSRDHPGRGWNYLYGGQDAHAFFGQNDWGGLVRGVRRLGKGHGGPGDSDVLFGRAVGSVFNPEGGRLVVGIKIFGIIQRKVSS